MHIYKYPSYDTWQRIISRPVSDHSGLSAGVREILNKVKEGGDKAVKEFSLRFDGVSPDSLRVCKSEMERAEAMVAPKLKRAIRVAAENISTFHRSQVLDTKVIETMPGVRCWQKSVPVERVGLYIPGGSAPLFSTVLMLGIPAKIAGCKDITLCTPPGKDSNIHPAILFSARLIGIDKVYRIGGVQAIGAMAYGTESLPRVYKIFGPGNAWVTMAKQIVSLSECAIDMPAGPSELAIMADSSAKPEFIAADILSQAEHGADSHVVLISTDELMVDRVSDELNVQIKELPREEVAGKALANSVAIVARSEEEMLEIVNTYAPEHLIISTRSAMDMTDRVINAGSVFLGNYTPESAGDYASGTNHTLPTHGWARSFSGLNVDSFCRKVTFQEVSHGGILSLGPTIEIMAEAEELFAHKNATTIRMNNIPEFD